MKRLLSNTLRAPARLTLHTFRMAVVGCHPAVIAAATILDILLFLAALTAEATHGDRAMLATPFLLSFVFIAAYIIHDMRFMIWFLGLGDTEINSHEFLYNEPGSRTDVITGTRVFILSTAASAFCLALFMGFAYAIITLVYATPASVAQIAGGVLILGLGLSCLFRRRATF
jgi:hypothetical protein